MSGSHGSLQLRGSRLRALEDYRPSTSETEYEKNPPSRFPTTIFRGFLKNRQCGLTPFVFWALQFRLHIPVYNDQPLRVERAYLHTYDLLTTSVRALDLASVRAPLRWAVSVMENKVSKDSSNERRRFSLSKRSARGGRESESEYTEHLAETLLRKRL